MKKPLFGIIILSESMHIFCCVLPTLFSLLGLLAGLGVIAALPPSFDVLHQVMHRYEVPLIIVSGLLIALGWGVDRYSRKIDCHDTGCCHPPCAPQKKRAHIILKVATGLFIVNVFVYAVFHQGLGLNAPDNAAIHDLPALEDPQ